MRCAWAWSNDHNNLPQIYGSVANEMKTEIMYYEDMLHTCAHVFCFYGFCVMQIHMSTIKLGKS